MNLNLENNGLSKETNENLVKYGYHKLTNIQKLAVPLILEGEDIIGKSNTGTGKTAAFIIPTLEKIKSSSKPQVLILVPTRELALQVSKEAEKLSKHTNLRCLAVYGGVDIKKQLAKFTKGVDIVIGTPGRIIDHLQRKSLQIDKLKVVILDEADKMIDDKDGFLEEIERILKKTPDNRQTLLFSATISPQIEIFSQNYLKNPQRIEDKDNQQQKSNIKQYYLEVPSRQLKMNFLINFICFKKPESALIFAATRMQVEKIYKNLIKQFKVGYIHGGLTQGKRNAIFKDFQERKISFLVATDVAARGLDVSKMPQVINYDLPKDSEYYTHRIGRTGRAGASGEAITLISVDHRDRKEKGILMNIVRKEKYQKNPFNLPKLPKEADRNI